jgi:hypothetical protein
MELLVELRSLSGIPERLPGNRAKKGFKYRGLNNRTGYRPGTKDLLHTSNYPFIMHVVHNKVDFSVYDLFTLT